jgi:hypothetical protein
VRELTVRDKIVSGGWGVIKVVHIESGPDAVDVPINTPVYYEAWALDRGNLLFYTGDDAGAGEEMKLCTEADEIRYPDGTVDSVYPADSIIDEDAACENFDYAALPTGEAVIREFFGMSFGALPEGNPIRCWRISRADASRLSREMAPLRNYMRGKKNGYYRLPTRPTI